jgi:hypothetical protein
MLSNASLKALSWRTSAKGRQRGCSRTTCGKWYASPLDLGERLRLGRSFGRQCGRDNWQSSRGSQKAPAGTIRLPGRLIRRQFHATNPPGCGLFAGRGRCPSGTTTPNATVRRTGMQLAVLPRLRDDAASLARNPSMTPVAAMIPVAASTLRIRFSRRVAIYSTFRSCTFANVLEIGLRVARSAVSIQLSRDRVG